MRDPLVVCPRCSRHVRRSESACPFCTGPVPADLTPVPHGPRRQYLGKGATAAYLTSLAVAGCGARTDLLVEEEDAAPRDTATGTDSAARDTSAAFDTALDSRADSASDAFDEGACCPIYK